MSLLNKKQREEIAEAWAEPKQCPATHVSHPGDDDVSCCLLERDHPPPHKMLGGYEFTKDSGYRFPDHSEEAVEARKVVARLLAHEALLRDLLLQSIAWRRVSWNRNIFICGRCGRWVVADERLLADDYIKKNVCLCEPGTSLEADVIRAGLHEP